MVPRGCCNASTAVPLAELILHARPILHVAQISIMYSPLRLLAFHIATTCVCLLQPAVSSAHSNINSVAQSNSIYHSMKERLVLQATDLCIMQKECGTFQHDALQCTNTVGSHNNTIQLKHSRKYSKDVAVQRITIRRFISKVQHTETPHTNTPRPSKKNPTRNTMALRDRSQLHYLKQEDKTCKASSTQEQP